MTLRYVSLPGQGALESSPRPTPLARREDLASHRMGVIDDGARSNEPAGTQTGCPRFDETAEV